MKSLQISCSLTLNFVAIVFLGIFQLQAQTTKTIKIVPKIQTISKSQKEKIEKIIREYLLKNPSIIREAMLALQEQEEKEKQEKTALNLKKMKLEIYSDPDSPVLGNPTGDVTIVVFFDYNCGYCKKTLPELTAFITQDATVKVVYKEFPILSRQSEVAARAALAAFRQGKYAEFHRALLETNGATDKEIKGISEQLKLDYTQLKKDMDDPKLREALERTQQLATALGVDGTPAYLIGDQFLPGAIDADSLAKIVSLERAKIARAGSIETIQRLKK